ncbi:bifunctional methylenetetrahydrofolate dehydrogenase/methenyltetrahydrofolate cyclohydrolase FolD [Sphingorhabdus sp.]|uniref:bifunctional methylenetetrahydrofolate dehydrogenase/methenyltetrahydrofolate cyclohydrolase FolD n=1 Tax=Sphingorhabdus sp. TaxID=1902408 RepID=UPI003BB0D071|nr:bifunctional methylenetetrahydrofolate dehydrogenase/methenyltetrahydrofolate cyclohydrolase FolD [Sphingomonadales bacterium]MBK9432331.1 bifunctional methylenetetrahydrofolate dehydrogenase/methenyltetrahydrofolate cyclohydrolase FolD [Sphingomonadales bacterium]MBL0022136.1 bifunctional methylenetetrahydrofolate dehydrogenase/methenyltetrahydrofolate cyclohydrolase FolD [Sphingomonadales bacterium]
MSEAAVIDGKAFAAGLRGRIAEAVPAFVAGAGRKPGLAVVLVGEDPASAVYVASKGKATVAAGMKSFEHRLPADTRQADLIALVRQLNMDDNVDGILVQLPLPKHLDEQAVVDAIDPDKDVDGLTPISTGRLALGLPGLVPCTPLGSLMLLKDRMGDLSGKDAIVIGRSILVGKPMAQLLLGENCTVTIAHSRTRDLKERVAQADIVVAAVGRAEMVKGDWLKPGAVVIDVGINRLDPAPGESKGRLVGDVDYASALGLASAITPVPGGVGPMTIACLLRNTLVAAHRRAGLGDPQGL